MRWKRATIIIEGTGQSATTDNAGSCAILDVQEGSYDITASKSGDTSQTSNVTIGSTAVVNFKLTEVLTTTDVRIEAITYSTGGGRHNDKHRHVSVTLADTLGDAIAGASVSILVEHNSDSTWSLNRTTGSNGTVTFSLNNARSGTYTTTVTAVYAEGLRWDSRTPANSFSKY